MNSCKQCGSYAINHSHHGRNGSEPDLCDVCYWRKRAEREWQDLTEEEIIECWPGLAVNKHTYPFARAIESMLKEKNT